MILETIVVGALSVNCYVVGCDETKLAAVIDPGDQAEKILQVINDHGLKLKYIILTHAHFDHAGAAKQLHDATGAEVLIHPEGEVMLKNIEVQAALFAMPAPPAPKPDGYIRDGDVLEVGNIRMKVIGTPGHSLDGISLYLEKEGVVFTGDTLFWGSIGRTDLPGGDYAAIMDSLKKKLGSLPDETVVYSGHGDETEIGFEKRENPFFE